MPCNGRHVIVLSRANAAAVVINDGTLVTEPLLPDPRSERAADRDPAARVLLEAAVRRARITIFWERLWPPLARTALLIVFVGVAVASLLPLVFLRFPGLRDGLQRLDRGTGVRHRPATAVADRLAAASS